jgi:hypothetical protein
MEHNECIGATSSSEYFPQEFLDSPLFKLLPEGYDVCYQIVVQPEMVFIHFYLYDSTVPLEEIDIKDVAGAIHVHYNKPHKWSYGWIPMYYNTLHIPELVTNSNLKGFNLSRSGIGSFMMLCAMAYSKSMNLHIALLYDASVGFRTDENIYTKLGFKYIDDSGHEMMGKVDEIYDKTSSFIETKGSIFHNKLKEYDQYLNDEVVDRPLKRSRSSLTGSGKKSKSSKKKKRNNKRKKTKKTKRKSRSVK